MSEEQFEMDLPDANEESIIDFLLWVSHGQNISKTNKYYKVLTPFAAVNFYSEPFTSVYSEFLRKVGQQDPGSLCKLITATCPKIPTEYCEDKSKSFVYLPPLYFTGHESTERPEDEGMRNLVGLWHFRVRHNGTDKTTEDGYFQVKNKCIMVMPPLKILSNDDVLRMSEKHAITYAEIQSAAKKYCKANNLIPKDVLFGIYSCQDISIQHLVNYNPVLNARDLIPTAAPDKIARFDSVESLVSESKLDVLYVPYRQIKPDFMFQHTSNNQGCALNILNYYGIMDSNTMRETMVCLPMQGTSIFKIMDYVDDYVKLNTQPVKNLRYGVFRAEIGHGFRILHRYWDIVPPGNFTVFKVYKDNLYKDKYNESGITVSVMKDADTGATQYIEMDVDASRVLEKKDDWVKVMKILMSAGYNYIDIVCTSGEVGAIQDEYLKYVFDHCVPRVRPPELLLGGRRRSSRKTRKSRK